MTAPEESPPADTPAPAHGPVPVPSQLLLRASLGVCGMPGWSWYCKMRLSDERTIEQAGACVLGQREPESIMTVSQDQEDDLLIAEMTASLTRVFRFLRAEQARVRELRAS